MFHCSQKSLLRYFGSKTILAGPKLQACTIHLNRIPVRLHNLPISVASAVYQSSVAQCLTPRIARRGEHTEAEITSVINFIWKFTYHVWQVPSQTDRSAPLLLGHADVLRLQPVADILVPRTEVTQNIKRQGKGTHLKRLSESVLRLLMNVDQHYFHISPSVEYT